MHLSPRAYGLWAGASIYEIAQAVAAAFQGGADAGQFGTIAKLTRVAMMAPVVIALGEMTSLLGLVGDAGKKGPRQCSRRRWPTWLADDEDAAYAVACVTVFGTLAMFAYPFAHKPYSPVATRQRPVGWVVDLRNRPGRRGGVPGPAWPTQGNSEPSPS